MRTMFTNNWRMEGFKALPLFDVVNTAALEPKYQAQYINLRPDTVPGSVSKGEDVGI